MKKLVLGLIVLGLLLIPLAVSADDTSSVLISSQVQASIACQAVKTYSPNSGVWYLSIADAETANDAVYATVSVQSNHEWTLATHTDSDTGDSDYDYDGYLAQSASPYRMFYKLKVMVTDWPDHAGVGGYETADAYITATLHTDADLTKNVNLRQLVSGTDTESTNYASTLVFLCSNVFSL